MITKGSDYRLSKDQLKEYLVQWTTGKTKFKDPAMHVLFKFYNTDNKLFLYGAYDVYAGEVNLVNPGALVKNKNYFGALTAFATVTSKVGKHAILGFVDAHYPDSIKMRVFPDMESGSGATGACGRKKRDPETEEL